MPKGVKRISNGESVSPLAVLLDSLIALSESDYSRLIKFAEEGRTLRIALDTIREGIAGKT
jgi:hypothetical protein